MKTIILMYDEHDPAAQKALGEVLSMGKFRIKRMWPFSRLGAWRTRRAIRDVERGKVIHCESFEEFKRMMEDV